MPATLALAALLALAAGIALAELLIRHQPRAAAARRTSRAKIRTVAMVLLAAFLFLAAYGSWVPFRITPLALADATRHFVAVLSRPLNLASKSDWATNVLLFAPIGFLATGVLRDLQLTSLPRSIGLPAAWFACLLWSSIIEFGQLWIVERTCSQNDLVAHGVGGLCGGIGWLLSGSLFIRWLDRFLAPAGPHARLERRLQVYLVLFAGYMLLPLDLTLCPAELYDKYQEGRITLVPFHDLQRKPAWEFLAEGLLAVPIGLFAGVWRWPDNARIRPFGKSLLLGAAILAGIEAGQIFVFSRHSSMTDLAIGCFALSLGWMIARLWASERWITVRSRIAFRSWILIAAPILNGLLLVAIYCLPVERIASPAEARVRLEGLLRRPPLASLYAGSPMNALAQSLRKILHFGLLGALSAWSIDAGSSKKQLRCSLIVVAWVAGVSLAAGIEWLQIYLPSHVSDTSDVVLAGLGTALGLTVIDARGSVEKAA